MIVRRLSRLEILDFTQVMTNLDQVCKSAPLDSGIPQFNFKMCSLLQRHPVACTRIGIQILSQISPRNGCGHELFEKYRPSFSEVRFATKALNLRAPQSEISPTNVRPRPTPGVLS